MFTIKDKKIRPLIVVQCPQLKWFDWFSILSIDGSMQCAALDPVNLRKNTISACISNMMKDWLLPKMQICNFFTVLLMLTVQQCHSCIKNTYQIDLLRTKCLSGYTGDILKMVHSSPALTEDVDRKLYDTTDEETILNLLE